jgi:tRNA (mo5U34)-methyltransferase
MDDLQTLVDGYGEWYHEIDFGNGVRSKALVPSENNRLIWRAISSFLDGIDFAGKTVLDIGCWDGMWSFEAERRGASRVVATDIADQRWGATEGFKLAHSIFQSKVEYVGDVSIYSACERLEQERFDIVLFLGVYYHLTHAVYGFTELRHLVADEGIAVVEGSAVNDQENANAAFLYGDGSEPERCDPSNWTIPTRRWVLDVLGSCYFKVVREEFPFDGPRGRMLVEAKAWTHRNERHVYRPPFGLHRYDDRWA